MYCKFNARHLKHVVSELTPCATTYFVISWSLPTILLFAVGLLLNSYNPNCRGISGLPPGYLFAVARISAVACFAIYRLICHLNLWKRIDKQGARNEHLNDRFFITDSNGDISIIDHPRLASGSDDVFLVENDF